MSSRPNIVVIMADDHGPWAVEGEGFPGVRTPHLRRLGAEGARFTRAYTPCPVCSPARASFFTGRFPSAHGIHDYLDERAHPDVSLTGQRTLPMALQEAGYEAALFGKWHCGQSNTPQPGFDRWFSHAWGHQHPHFGDVTFATGAWPIARPRRRPLTPARIFRPRRRGPP